VNTNLVTPYLSIVIPFRNDNYSPNAIEKLNLSLKILIDQLNGIKLDSEIIIIDWNSPDPKKPLINEIAIKKNSKNVSLYVYEIERSIHLRYKGHEKINIVVGAALNVGFRRSRGKFVVGKMGDTFYSKKLIDFLGKKKLKEDEIYRLDRVDVEIDFPPPSDWESHFNENIVIRKSSLKNLIHTKACGDFLLMSKNKWFTIRGFPENKNAVHNGDDGEALYAAIGSGAKQVYLQDKMCIYKINHPNLYASRIKHKQMWIKNNFAEILLGSSQKNILQKFLIVVLRIIMGILNLPNTRIYDLKTRSINRYYLVANFRRLFFGGNFIISDNWGLPELNFKKKNYITAKWDS
jgi:hypothetical protein